MSDTGDGYRTANNAGLKCISVDWGFKQKVFRNLEANPILLHDMEHWLQLLLNSIHCYLWRNMVATS